MGRRRVGRTNRLEAGHPVRDPRFYVRVAEREVPKEEVISAVIRCLRNCSYFATPALGARLQLVRYVPESVMSNTGVGRARIGQWYTRSDKGEIFQVTGYDPDSRSIEVQTFDGDLDEIDLESWTGLPLALAEPPEDWTGPMDDVERDDLGYTETDMTGEDWAAPLQTLRSKEEGEEATADDEGDPEGEDFPVEEFALDNPAAAPRLR